MGTLKEYVKQPSTWRGLALLGSAAALVTGHGDVFSAQITESGVQYGGAVGFAVTSVVGLWETLRNQQKEQR